MFAKLLAVKCMILPKRQTASECGLLYSYIWFYYVIDLFCRCPSAVKTHEYVHYSAFNVVLIFQYSDKIASMVVMKNSEYRTNYEPKFEKHAQEYSQNLGYRTTRRSAEFAHNRDVFTWEPEAWEKASTTSVLEEVPRPGVNPSTRYKHAMFNKEYNERVLSQCIQEQCHIDDTNNNQVGFVLCPG